MLTALYLENFKCFEQLDLQLRPLTLLSGLNSGGKSSVLQALVLLAQTLSRHEWSELLWLDGVDLALGTAADVLNQRAPRRELVLGVSVVDEEVRWSFHAEDRRAQSVKLSQLQINGAAVEVRSPLRWLLPAQATTGAAVVRTLRRLTWICAERIGPREFSPLIRCGRGCNSSSQAATCA